MEDSFIKEIKRPATIISIIIAILSIIIGFYVSLYFYYKSEKKGIIFYELQQIKVFDNSVIQSSKNNSNYIKVIGRDGKYIDKSIFAATIKIWNGGNNDIPYQDVRVPFKLNFQDNINIIEISLDNTTRDNADKFEITSSGGIRWQHFDPMEGFTIRLIYYSEKSVDINISGYAVNAEGISNINDIRSKIKENQFNMRQFLLPMLILLLIIFYNMFHFFVNSFSDEHYNIEQTKNNTEKMNKIRYYITMTAVIGLFIMYLYSVYIDVFIINGLSSPF